MRSRALVGFVLTAIAACDRVFQLESVSDAGSRGDGDAPSTGELDAPPPSGHCLDEHFEQQSIDTGVWTVQASPEASVAVSDGQLVFTLSIASGSHYAQIEASSRDFTNDVFGIELVAPASSQTSAEVGLKLNLDSNNYYQLIVSNDGLTTRMTNNGAMSDSVPVPYDPAAHKFLRLRHAGTEMMFETSGNGTVWKALPSRPATVSVTALAPAVYGGTFQQEPVDPGQARFDNAYVECIP